MINSLKVTFKTRTNIIFLVSLTLSKMKNAERILKFFD